MEPLHPAVPLEESHLEVRPAVMCAGPELVSSASSPVSARGSGEFPTGPLAALGRGRGTERPGVRKEKRQNPAGTVSPLEIGWDHGHGCCLAPAGY